MNRPIPSWLPSAIFYELYPQSFLDTDGDGIGDLKGVTRKLDYIRSLGCDAIWMNPCFASPFRDAGYDISDFYQVAPRYGSNDDLKRLFAEAHSRDMKICLDLVAGHTSDQHPWFVESCRNAPNKYSNWYIWTNSVWETAPNTINGYGERDGNFLANFFCHQPALNYGYAVCDPKKPWQLPVNHPDVQAVRAELLKIMRHWLDMGADGFRVDMAASLVKADPDLKETMALWREVRDMFDREYPNAVLMSEWSCPSKSIHAGFHVDFMLAFGNPPAYTCLLRKEKERNLNPASEGGHSYFDKEGRGDIREFLDEYLKQYDSTRGHGYIAIPSGNHDTPRLGFFRTAREIETVFALIMTMPGIPFIYNGDEIGMNHVMGLPSKEGGYNRTGARTPMQWDRSANAGFSSADPSMLYLPIDPSPGRPTVADQEPDRASLLNAVRRLAALRKEHAALFADGHFTPILAEKGKYPFIYQRADHSGAFVIAINPSRHPVSISIPADSVPGQFRKLFGSEVSYSATHGKNKLEMPGISYAILETVH